jgi:hypothetical protein
MRRVRASVPRRVAGEILALDAHRVGIDGVDGAGKTTLRGRGVEGPGGGVQPPLRRRQRIYLNRCTPQRRASRVVDNNDVAAPLIVG